jgi:hypothetical protein
MKLLLSPLLALAPLALARERPVDPAAHRHYASGEVMNSILAAKEATWAHYQELGYFAPGRHSSTNRFAPCRNGYVTLKDNGNITNYACKNLDVTGHLTHDDLGSVDATARIGVFSFLLRKD